jgi:AcrR family transcriptional regulator
MSRPAKSTPRENKPDARAVPVVKESRRERNKRDKLNRIVGAARGLFQTQGYAATTTQQISRAAGIASGTLFLYAKSKEDLLVLVFINEMNDLIETTYQGLREDDDLIDQAMGLFNGFIDYHAKDTEIARELIRELTFLSNPERIDEVNQIALAIVGKLLIMARRGQSRGEIRKNVDAQLLARCLFSIYYQQLQTWLSGYVSRDTFAANLKALQALAIDQRKR